MKNDFNLRLHTPGGQGSYLSHLSVFLQCPGQPGHQQVLSGVNAGRQNWVEGHLGEKGGSNGPQL